MYLTLQILLIAYCVQGLVKFAVGFLVPYRIRAHRHDGTRLDSYQRDMRLLGTK